MFRDLGDVGAQAAEREGPITPVHREVMFDEVVFFVYFCLCELEYASLLIDEGLAVSEGLYKIYSKGSYRFGCLQFFNLHLVAKPYPLV